MSTDYGYEAALQRGIDEAKALLEHARESGIRFESYLPPSLAEWLLQKIANGRFANPSEAVFLILSEHRDLESFRDLREEANRRIRLQESDWTSSDMADGKTNRPDNLLRNPMGEAARWRSNNKDGSNTAY